MAATLRALSKRTFEDRLAEAVICLDCGADRGRRCLDMFGRQRVMCCQARLEFGAPILRADADLRYLLQALRVQRDGQTP